MPGVPAGQPGQAVASIQGASGGVGTAACQFSPDTSVASPLTACCPGFSPFTAVFFLPLPLSLSSSFSPSLSLSLFQEGSHSMPSCCLFWFFSSPCPCCWAPALLSPVCIHFPCSASLPALLLSCLKAGGAGAAPSAGRGEPLSRTHGVDQKRLKFSGSGSALDVILIKPRCLVKQ